MRELDNEQLRAVTGAKGLASDRPHPELIKTYQAPGLMRSYTDPMAVRVLKGGWVQVEDFAHQTFKLRAKGPPRGF